MSRLSRDNKREAKRAARSAAPSPTPVPPPADVPVDVRVPLPGGPGAAGVGASVDGARIVAAPGQEIQHAVLNHLQRLALTAGGPVLATVHDERIGYVVPLRVHADGSSSLAGEPVPMAPQPSHTPQPSGPAQAPQSPPPLPQPYEPLPPHRDKATHALRAATPGAGETAPTFPLRAVPEPVAGPGDAALSDVPPGDVPVDHTAAPDGAADDTTDDVADDVIVDDAAVEDPASGEAPEDDARTNVPTFPLRAVPETARPQPQPQPQPPAPLGAFGPPPVMDSRPAAPDAARAPGHGADRAPVRDVAPRPPAPDVVPRPPAPDTASGPVRSEARPAAADPVASAFLGLVPEPDPKPTPARGFDAVAEAVLSDEPVSLSGDGGVPALLAEPMALINEAVKEGRIAAAAELSEHTVEQAAHTLGEDHPEVLRLRELTAYIAYLAGDPVRSLGLSLDLVHLRRRTGDAEAAYGNVQSAASAWRAVRDPELGLRLGRELIALWTELADEDGPAAEDIEELESARARMGRLTERARKASAPTTD